MKKIATIVCALLLVVTLAACGNQSKKVEQKSKDTASSKVTVNYRHKTVKYLYQKNNKDYTANFPELSEEAPNYQKANDLLKNTAMQTILSFGTKQEKAKTTVQVKSKLSFYSNDFVSATYKETSNTTTDAHPNAQFRTANFDLKKGTQVKTEDMIVKGDALNALLLKTAKKQLDHNIAEAVTADIIKSGMKSCSIYFEHQSIGFSMEVNHALGDHIEIELKYDEVKPFITTNELWKNFITK